MSEEAEQTNKSTTNKGLIMKIVVGVVVVVLIITTGILLKNKFGSNLYTTSYRVQRTRRYTQPVYTRRTVTTTTRRTTSGQRSTSSKSGFPGATNEAMIENKQNKDKKAKENGERSSPAEQKKEAAPVTENKAKLE